MKIVQDGFFENKPLFKLQNNLGNFIVDNPDLLDWHPNSLGYVRCFMSAKLANDFAKLNFQCEATNEN